MGLFGFLRRSDERAMPEPGTPEFEAAVAGTAIPDSQSVSMGESGWTSTAAADARVEQPRQTIDLRGSGHRPQIEAVLREHGIDPDKQGQTIDASTVPGLRKALLSVLFGAGVRTPDTDGFAGGIPAPKQGPKRPDREDA
jgi:hypothetical protein